MFEVKIMKYKVMIFVLLVFFGVQESNATAFSNYLPEGKNYLDQANFTVGSGTMTSIDSIRVKPETAYTFHIPDNHVLSFPQVRIWSSTEDYVQGDMESLSECTVTTTYTSCTFTTSDEEFLDIELSAMGIEQYIGYYGFENIQLEEGTIATNYEEYRPSFTDVTSPDFDGGTVFVKAYYEDITLQDIIDSHIVVYDDIDGEITSSIEVVQDPYTANRFTVGEYTVDLKATDSSGNYATFQLVIIVNDDADPTITGPSDFTINVDDSPSIETIVAENYEANDGHDGIIDIIIESDEYTEHKLILGEYEVELATIDSSGNYVNRVVTIHVVDTSSPVIHGSGMITNLLSSPKDLNTMLESLIISDNYNDVEDIEVEVTLDNFTGYETTPGVYNVQLSISDTSANTTLYSLSILVRDDILPTITGQTQWSTSYTTPYSVNDILADIEVSDNYDTLSTEDVTIISDNYSTRTDTVGTFTIVVQVEDFSENAKTLEITIELIDDQAPNVFVDNYLIMLTPPEIFAPRDALNMMIKNKELDAGEYEIVTVKDDYTGNEDYIGTYQYTLQFIDEDGDSIEKDFYIKVVEEEQQTSVNKSVIFRNVAVYGVVAIFSGFVVYKTKK